MKSLLAALCLAATAARALAPHECLVLVNGNEPDSLAAANWFAHLRAVPPVNVVRADRPPSPHQNQMGTNEWRRVVQAPARAAIKERGLEDRIAAWIYSAGFPTTILTKPEMSITGFTFTRGEVPPEPAIQNGMYLSPYFAGPARENAPAGPSAGFRARQRPLGARAPVPAMMLGYTGRNGTDLATVVEVLKRGAASDRTLPKGEVQFLFQDDIRWSCREWQMLPAVKELEALGAGARIVNSLKRRGPALAGLMTGAQRVDLGQLPGFAPGALAEHLTSFGAYFNEKQQMKSTAWLEHGATATAGTITEPFAIWSKFPHARSFVHQAAGCTMIESIYQGLACPFQSLVLGEPLANPRARPRTLAVTAERRDGAVTVRSRLTPFDSPMEFELLVDGAPFGRVNGTGEWTLPEAEIGTGHHDLLVVARMDDPVAQAVWTTAEVEVPDPFASIAIEGPRERRAADEATLVVRTAGLSGEVTLAAGAASVERKPAAAELSFTVTRAASGGGPVRVQATGLRADGRVVRSAPALVWMDGREK